MKISREDPSKLKIWKALVSEEEQIKFSRNKIFETFGEQIKIFRNFMPGEQIFGFRIQLYENVNYLKRRITPFEDLQRFLG